MLCKFCQTVETIKEYEFCIYCWVKYWKEIIDGTLKMQQKNVSN